MYLEFAYQMLKRPDIPNSAITILLYGVVLPVLWMLRVLAIVGIIYPVVKAFYNILFEKKHFFVLFSLAWIAINAMVLISPVDMYWKWVWIDFIGSWSIFIVFIDSTNPNKKNQLMKFH